MVCTLELRNLEVVLNGETILKNLSLKFDRGLYQIIGPNGAGKTTLLRTVLGLIKPKRGVVLLNGEEITGTPEKISFKVGYVPQLSDQNGDFPVTAFEIVLNSLLLHTKRFPRIASKEDIKRVEKTLKLVDLAEDRWDKPFHELSGGEKQRVLLARALVYDPCILLLDEPLSAIDPVGKVEFVKLISELSKNKLVIVTSHDPILFLPYTKEIVVLNRTFYRIGKPENILTLKILKEVYGESAMLLREHVHISDAH